MAVDMVNFSHTVPLTQVIRARYSSSPISVPADREALLYARFKHVRGLPTPAGEGLPLSKLQALDNLIERLGKAVGKEGGGSVSKPRGGEIDRMIQDYSRRIHDTITRGNYGLAGRGLLEPGIVVNQLA
jgi:hypothetical protein